jgi:hypothetical protein
MAFDAESFRKEAKGKFTNAEIEAVIARETAGVKPLTEEPTKQETQVAPAYDWLKPAAGGLAAGGALLGGKAIYDSLKDKVNATAQTRIEPSLDVSTRPALGEPTLDMQALTPNQAPVAPTIEELKAKFGLPSTPEVPVVQAPVAQAPVVQPSVAPVETVQPLKLSEWAAGAQPTTPVAPPVSPAQTPAEQAAIEKLTTTTPVAAPEGANAPAIPTEEQKATAEKAVKEKMPLFSDADKKAFTSEQRSVLQHMQYGQKPEEAKALLRHFENTLPEGVKLSYGTYPEDVFNEAGKKIKTAGTSKGGFPEPKQNLLNFWNEALGTSHGMNEKGNFDYKPTAEDVSKAHSYWSDKLKNASSPAEIANAQKGFASLGALASLAGVSLAALGAMSAYKEGKETGDWSGLGLLGGSLIAGASAPAQVAYQAATYSKPLGETQEQLKEFGKRLEYAAKVGSGRGMQGSTGGGQGFRGIAPPSR